MSYLNTANGAYPLSADDIKHEHQGTSFPGDAAGFELAISRMGYAVVAPTAPPAVDYTKNISEAAPAVDADGYKQVWQITPASADEIAQRTANEADAVREERNQRLSACDWTQLSDAPVDSNAWASYRQALRDLTNQSGFPWTVQWPDAPSS